MENAMDDPWSIREMTPQPLRIRKRDVSGQSSYSPDYEVKDGSPTTTSQLGSRALRKVSSKPESIKEAHAVDGSNTMKDLTVSQTDALYQVSSPVLSVRKTRRRDTESSGSRTHAIATDIIKSPASSAKYGGMLTSPNIGKPPHGFNHGSERTQQIMSRQDESSAADTMGSDTFLSHGANPGLLTEPRSHLLRHQGEASGGVSAKKDDKASNKLVASPNLSSQDVNRQPSFRHRMLNRIASGFPVQSNPPQSNRDRATGEVSLQINRIATGEGRSAGKLRSATLDSGRTAQTQGSFASGLDAIIASFPSPAKTAPTTEPSPALQIQATFPPRKLAKPKEATILGAKLTLVPGESRVTTSDVNRVETFWVAVQVEGIIDSGIHGAENERDNSFLDIFVIIDNSLHTSPAALMSSCTIAGELASTLDQDRDRIAIGTTSPLGQDIIGDGLIPLPLSKICARQVKKVLDSIVGCATIPAPDYLTAQIMHAKKHFGLRTPHLDDSPPSFAAFGHIIVLTPNPGAIPNSAYTDEYIGLHIICPGSIPWRRVASGAGDGWRIHDLLQSIDPLSPARSTNSQDHHSKIYSLASQLRSGSAPGKLVDLKVVLRDSPGCVLTGQMGKMSFPSLQPGEVRTIMARIKMKTPRPDQAFPLDFDPVIGPSVNDGLIRHMEALVGSKSLPVLDAKLRYRHSKLPQGTVCELRSTASVEVSSRPSAPPGISGKEDNRQQSLVSLSHVTKCLIYHLATHAETPGEGLVTLREHFSSEMGEVVCTEYLSLVVDELKYQERILQRLEMASNIGDTFKELVGGSPRRIVGYKPFSWIKLPEDEFLGELRHMTSRGTVVETPSEDELVSRYRELRNMKSKPTIVEADDGVQPHRELRQVRSRATVVETLPDDEPTPSRKVIRQHRSKATDMNSMSKNEPTPSKNELTPPRKQLRHMRSKAPAVDAFSEEVVTPPSRGLGHHRSRIAVVDTLSQEELTLPHEGFRHPRSKGKAIDSSPRDATTPPSRQPHHARSRATVVDSLSEDDVVLPSRGHRQVRPRAPLVETPSEDEFASPHKGLRHFRSNAIVGQESLGSPRLQRVVRHARSRAADGEGLEECRDPARQIWGGLRKEKEVKGESDLGPYGGRSPLNEGSQERIKQFQEQAVRNKRSVGQDTLLSMARRGTGDENVTPWL